MLDSNAGPLPLPVLDAETDLKRKAALDRPPAIDRLAAIRAASARGRDRGWLQALLGAICGPGKLTFDEFFYYGLDRPGTTTDAARAYVGKKVQHLLHNACNNGYWYAPSHDKALFYTILRGAGLPAPETLALVGPSPRGGYVAVDATPEGFAECLRQLRFPVFAKPVDGIYSIGTLIIEGVDGDEVLLRGQGSVTCEALVTYMRRLSPTGYLVQSVLSAAPALSEITGATVPSLRLLIIASQAPRVLSAALKLPAGSNHADNFWRTGNVLAAVDRETGTVIRGIVNAGDRVPQERPNLAGLAVPDWEAARDMALRAATLFPPIRTQSWDVALTDSGPVLLEFNFGGDLNLHQLSHDRGILTDEFRDHLRRCGYRGRLI